MRLGYTKSAHTTSYYVYKSAYVNGRRTTVMVEKLGNNKQICEKYGVDDAEAWARNHVAELNKKSSSDALKIVVPFSAAENIPLGDKRLYNAGYLFLQKIFYSLGLDKICTAVKKRHGFDYNLTSILSRLIYTRILFPSSKKTSFELSSSFIEMPDFDLHQVYRALSVLAVESDYVQSVLYKNTLKYAGRKTGIIYYDCTNYYFETEEASGDRQYGHSKENRPNPIVEMGLFMDAEGIPLAFCIHPGNTNEQITMNPLEKKLLSDFGLSRFVVCTDAGLSSSDNRKFNNTAGRAFITTQSLKKLKGFQREWCLDINGWRILGGNEKTYSLDLIDEKTFHDTTFYKERWFNENGIEQKMIVTYSMKYRDYLRNIRNRQIERAQAKLKSPASIKSHGANDPKRFISRESMTYDGEAASRDIYYINEEIISQEEMYDGFYGVCTNLEDDAEQIIAINKRRWQIEECFRIMKHEFKARPAYLSRDDRIKAHFMTCFIALIVYRFLEKELSCSHTVSQIISALRSMNMLRIEGYGYIPAYDRTELTDALHSFAGFDTSKEIIPLIEMKHICRLSKNR